MTNNDAEGYGVQVWEAAEAGATARWECIRVHHLTPAENSGNHNLFVELLDENGARAKTAKAQVTNADGSLTVVVMDKPANEPGGNCPVFRNDLLSVNVICADGEVSDIVVGISTKHPDDPSPPGSMSGANGNTLGHHSFLVVFQRRVAAPAVPSTPPPVVPPVTPAPGGDPAPVSSSWVILEQDDGRIVLVRGVK